MSGMALGIAVVHVVWPSLRIDNTTVLLLVVAVSPWLGELFSSIELPGGAKLEYRRLEQRMDEADVRAALLDHEVDGAAATARVALAAAGSSPLADQGEDDSSAADALERLTADYVRLRESTPSSPSRTSEQERIFAEMLKIVPRIREFDVDAMLTSENAGRRLAAVARLYSNPDPAKLIPLVEMATSEELPFLIYWAFNALSRVVHEKGADQVPIGVVRRLRAHVLQLPVGSDRAGALHTVLAKFNPPGPGAAPGF